MAHSRRPGPSGDAEAGPSSCLPVVAVDDEHLDSLGRATAGRYARQQPAPTRVAWHHGAPSALRSETEGRGKHMTAQQGTAGRGPSLVLATVVAVGAFVAAMVLYDVVLGISGYGGNEFWWARAVEGVLIGGAALVAWTVAAARLGAIVGLAVTTVLLALGLAEPSSELWSSGQSPVIWALAVVFAVRAVVPAARRAETLPGMSAS